MSTQRPRKPAWVQDLLQDVYLGIGDMEVHIGKHVFRRQRPGEAVGLYRGNENLASGRQTGTLGELIALRTAIENPGAPKVSGPRITFSTPGGG